MSEERTLQPKAVLQYALNGEFIREYHSVYCAAKSVKGCQSNISSCCAGRQKRAYGYQWRFKEESDILPVTSMREGYICKFSLDGKKLGEYPSVRDAAKSLLRKYSDKPINVLCSGVFSCCKRNFGKAYGYQWRFKENVKDTESIDSYKRSISKVIVCYNLKGKAVARYNSLIDAAKVVIKDTDKRKVSTAANNIAKHCISKTPIYGYLWEKVE